MIFPSVKAIQQIVSEHFDLYPVEMVSRRRARRYSRPRQIAMTLARDLTPCSYPEIAREFGKRDHTTIMHAVRAIEGLCERDAEFSAMVAELRERAQRTVAANAA